MAKEKPKIKILEIDLGVDVSKEIKDAAKGISKDVQDKINKMVEEKKAKGPTKKAKKAKEKERLEACFQRLFTSFTDDTTVDGAELLKIYEIPMNLSPLVLKIRNFLKKNKPDFSLEKTKRDGKTHYFLKRSDSSS